MQALTLHPSCDTGPITAVSAKIRPTEDGCEAEFVLSGGIDQIVLPEPGPSLRTDDLWKTTCFEIFWQPLGGSTYREFNLSPSGRWAAYDFDGFREGMRDAPVEAMALATAQGSANGKGELVLKAAIAAELPAPAQVALNAIVEHRDGGLQFWALAFDEGKAEFHSETCRQWKVERV
ncbi:hypothetical protein [uncultured Erythrobacter sp.]|uniref:hypothetical protein n=1 Tax=uncultured Erythrobacter sp. TaxID=263913 RepID=UPI00262443C6|nr:hypothetical protein [uncultured Erythrobacter sp.]